MICEKIEHLWMCGPQRQDSLNIIGTGLKAITKCTIQRWQFLYDVFPGGVKSRGVKEGWDLISSMWLERRKCKDDNHVK